MSLSVKDGLISEGILTLVPLPEKCAKSRPLRSKFKYVVYCKGREIQSFCSGANLASFVGNVIKVKLSSEVKPPLDPLSRRITETNRINESSRCKIDSLQSQLLFGHFFLNHNG